ncbi:hypothetical protein BC835DRAFT_543444 [Cytidiella melzeri]|nr:hypothetical protein BC835DRAFT_543444 [Cytidiella melzeri]
MKTIAYMRRRCHLWAHDLSCLLRSLQPPLILIDGLSLRRSKGNAGTTMAVNLLLDDRIVREKERKVDLHGIIQAKRWHIPQEGRAADEAARRPVPWVDILPRPMAPCLPIRES